MRAPHRAAIALAAAALLTAGVAQAAPLSTPEAALARAATGAYPGETYSQYNPYRPSYRRRGNGGAVAAGVIGGLAAGALIGGALAGAAAPPPPPVYGPAYGPGPAPVGFYGGPGPGQPVGNVYGRDPNWVSYCASRYPGFDPISGTFAGRDGFRYPCR